MAKLNLRRFIKIAVIITLMLAVIEVVVIFVMSEKKDKSASRKNNDSTTQAAKTNGTDSSAMQASGYGATSSRSSYSTPDTTVAQAAPATDPSQKGSGTGPSETYTTPSKAKPLPDTASLPSPPKAKPVAKVPSAQLSNMQLLNILNDVLAEKKRLNIAAKCVQVQKSKNSNVGNAFEVADFFAA